ncbi:UDP-3-O-(3-hydroxymyristoyl)glucosamine N-acyltransferase [Oceanobacter sp. 5_MG-2023]|uniref:UDP-3-O-(3-hydroxymyristoyl)glucosamine N-acyltransferase n=1 Tax=Oceanobacter sp. 5_MG-2023 TaxID=3062645 RepID=UPI0026E4942B|nr:UDP-3-O-(3-hydroxymyristoyl)glucosamine N-acyltransferase [Oceanobacter sp. 5_MG-2023]MDO6682813.1 UDP-3-O-(3-hydroxymyristoyl)glucosamine N-acyltransferase [Oceanobacter sp. 5_MG-2023]
MDLSLSELATYLGAEIRGDGSARVDGVAPLSSAGSSDVTFIADPAYRKQLDSTAAAAVIVGTNLADDVASAALVVEDAYLAFAKTTQLFDRRPRQPEGVHPRAIVEDGVVLGAGVRIGPGAVIGRNTHIGDGTEVGAGCVIGSDCRIGRDCLLFANVTLYYRVSIGDRVRVQSGAVIGSDGFGFAPNKGKWERIAQLGNVRIGNNVEIGANTCIDRGALEDTVIEDDVILDNLIQIAHNVHVGQGAAMAGCVGIAGSTHIGKGCTLAGGVGIAGHLTLADGVHALGMTLITNSIDEPGVYASGTSHMPAKQWRRSAARFKQLDSIAKRLQKLEKSQEGNA